MLPAARLTDLIVSTATSGVPAPLVAPGCLTVIIGGLPAARMGDTAGADAVIKGSGTVMIGGLPAARVSDLTAGGGAVLPPGCLSVLVGG